MAGKSNIRSMRFSDEIIEIIESQAGETFTAKFEALVQRCMWELPRKEKELEDLNKAIKEQRERYLQIRKQTDAISSQLNNFKYSLQNMEFQVNRAADSLKNTVDNP